jgi:UDP-N-acetylmuramoylalanine--D-glutamate ligase
MDSYAAAKARIWEHQRPADAAIGFAADPVVMAHLASAPGRRLTFALERADYAVRDGWLSGPAGEIAPVSSMRRSLPHDVTNALAAAALVLESSTAGPEAVAEALASFEGVAHRIAFVGEANGVRWFDDSKATTPHAAVTAVAGFDHVVLLAGGRNKGLDLRDMAAHPERMRAVVALGEATADIVAAFDGVCPVVALDPAARMDAAVAAAEAEARPGDTVLLSPGCASWDWYPTGGYAARGDDFARCVREQVLA